MATCIRRPRDANKANRRKVILGVAERSFLERGYADTSMSTIAAELGGSKSTLWTYFPSKEELFAAVLESKIANFQEALDEALLPVGDSRAALGRFGQALLGKITSPDAIGLHRLVVAEASRFPSIGAAFASCGPDRVRQRLAQWISAEMAAGRLREGDSELAACQFIALCQARFYFDRLWRPARNIGGASDDVPAAVCTFMAAWGMPSQGSV